jgi:hypothetical protein
VQKRRMEERKARPNAKKRNGRKEGKATHAEKNNGRKERQSPAWKRGIGKGRLRPDM